MNKVSSNRSNRLKRSTKHGDQSDLFFNGWTDLNAWNDWNSVIRPGEISWD